MKQLRAMALIAILIGCTTYKETPRVDIKLAIQYDTGVNDTITVYYPPDVEFFIYRVGGNRHQLRYSNYKGRWDSKATGTVLMGVRSFEIID